MSFFTNKHVVTAILVVPILAIVSYLAVDYFVKPDPIAAKRGHAYPLIAKSNCRYASSQCTLVNGDFRLDIYSEPELQSSAIALSWHSEHALQGLRISLINTDEKELYSATFTKRFVVLKNELVYEAVSMRLALSSRDVKYYSEVPLTFIRVR